MDDKFIISEEQKNRLKELLTEEEYKALTDLKFNDFYDTLSGFIDIRYEDCEPTPKSDALEAIYYEIYNQN